MKKRLLGLLLMFCAFSFFKVNAQEFSPFMSSPYAGVTAGQLNPASLAGSKYKFDVTLLGFSSGVHNSLLTFSRKEIIFNTSFYKDLWDYRSDFFDLNIPTGARNDIKHYLQYTSGDWDKDKNGGYVGGQLDILNLMYSFTDRFTMAAGYSKRFMGSASGVPMEVASEFFNGYVPGAGSYRNVTWEDPTNASVAIYDQIFLSAAYSIVDNQNHRFKVGLTGKLIFNGKSAFGFAENYRATLTGGARGVSAINGTTFGEAGKAVDSKIGFAGDIGLEYEYRPDELMGDEVAEYRVKVGASLLDFGGYKSENATYRTLGNGTGTPTGFDQLISMYGTGGNRGDYTMALPMMVTASIDYRFGGSPLFLNFTPYIALNQNSAHKAFKFTSFNLTPHLEWKNFGVSVPFQYDQYGRFTAGIGIRAWRHVWIGSNTIFKNLWPGDNHNYSADIHVMVKVPILKDKDRDGDGVPDRIDRCPDVPGLKRFQGCPDTDGDGIPDDQDACPTEPGPASTNGCPDRDGDGIPDKDDRCPDQPGPIELQGCPDRDGDGIPDIDDRCPDQPGPASLQGCPDRDGDGVPDIDDRCPDQPGPASLQGCPDRDGDGVPDIDDECPDVPGPASNRGCPLPTQIQNVEFDIDKYNIKPQYHAELDKVVQLMSTNPEATVNLVGHTDITYTRAYNMQLSKRRAESVKNYLVSKGADARRITTEYYGPDRPIADNNTIEGRSRNRRTEITIVIR